MSNLTKFPKGKYTFEVLMRNIRTLIDQLSRNNATIPAEFIAAFEEIEGEIRNHKEYCKPDNTVGQAELKYSELADTEHWTLEFVNLHLTPSKVRPVQQDKHLYRMLRHYSCALVARINEEFEEVSGS